MLTVLRRGPAAVARAGAARPAAALAWAVVLAMMALALAAPWIAPYDAVQPSGERLLTPGTSGHPLGTDQFGRDQLSRLLWGARPLIVVSLASAALSALIGSAIGLVVGAAGGWTDLIVMRAMDLLLCFPLILLAIVVVAALGPGLANLVLAITASQMPVFARLARSLALREAARDYVLAARAMGSAPWRIVVVEIAPNTLGPIVVQATSVVAVAALTSSALSYLGLGIQPPTPDWGYMVKEGQEMLFFSPWGAVVPGIAIAVFATAWTFIGDDLSDRVSARGIRS